MVNFLLSLLTLSFLTSYVNAQQNYSKNSVLDCNANDDTGPSSAFLYTCNGQNQSCQAFLFFKPQPSFHSVPSISAITSANQEELARLNNVTRLSEFPTNIQVIVPVKCSCFGQYYQANTTIQVTATRGTYYVIAKDTYQGLSTCAALKHWNTHGEYHLLPGQQLQVPLRCACPTMNQIIRGTNYIVTYPLSTDDNIPDIADRFDVSIKSILDANGMAENPTLYPYTTILIPLPTQPTSSQTTIHSTPDISPTSALSPGNRRSKKKLYESAGLAAACSLLVLGIITAVLFLSCKKRRDKVCGSSSERKQVVPEDLRVEIASCEQVLKVFKFEEVRKATENFCSESKIKGSVYRGEFGGEILAVKKMGGDATKEVNILKRTNHFNLIKLEGVSENLGCFYLVLEYMGNGSLRECLSSKKFKETGNWTERIQIALDVANGLHYLHCFTEPPYVHQDIKSSNVLLNGNLRAKIANFSLARAATRETKGPASTKHIVGTRGYMAPEYVGEGRVTPKIDVYAFGVILLELITRKDAVFTQDGREILLSTAIVSIMENKNPETELDFYIDPDLKGSCGTDFALCLAKASVACLMKEPARRPSMEEVVAILLKIQANVQKS
ncbi:unnamed protein product [Dovyalis caffra]|uniref:Uncharacterized protein n=1 Tax=Dovyalis caffra TaxID=77055 RepID=A0AAV1SC00_9ROSI|nr:unnamed protein product [Dovyalis caffra]